MSYAVRRIVDPSTAPTSSGEPPPTTATVLDYICLFTHDLRRKQKRWQDGKLKYHTFNKRIMVYDDRGNFIGDAHWHGGGDLDEGEELELDRGAAIVQVADCVGSREQDLTEVLDKRVREVEKRRAVAAAKTPASSRVRTQPQQQEHFQLNHRPLSSLVDSPGPIGRAAISTRSPYEARKAVGTSDGPPMKKRRVSPSPPSKAGFAQNLFGATLNLSAGSVGASSLRMRALRERTNLQREEDGVGKERVVEEEDGDVVVVDERRSKVVVRKAKCFNDAQERAIKPIVKASREVNDEPSARAVSTTLDDISSVQRPQSKPVRQGTRHVNQEPLLKTVPKTVEECQRRHEALIPDTDDSQSRAITKTRTERLPPSTSVRQDCNREATRETTLDHTVPRVAKHAMARNASPGPPVFEAPDVEIIHAITKPRKDVVHTESKQRRHVTEDTVPTSKSRKETAHDEPKKKRQVVTEDTVPTSKSRKETVHNERKKKERQMATEDNVAFSKALPEVPTRKTEKRTELRIKSRQRRGLLMMSERKQGHQSHSTSVTPTSSVHTVEVRPTESVVRSESPVIQVPEEEFPEEPDAEPSRRENVLRSESPILQFSEEDLLAEPSVAENVDEIAEQQTIKATPEPSPPCSPEAIKIDSDSERDVAATKHKPSESLKTDRESASEPDEVIQRSRKRQKKSPEIPPKNAPSSENESHDSPPRRTTRVRRKMASKDQRDSSSDEQPSDKSPRRKKRQTRGKISSESSSSKSSSDEDSEEVPAGRAKRTRGQRASIPCEEPANEPTGPRIKRMARKSVKCKEIFGFIPPASEEELVPAPFSMATGRIGMVGRPPAAPTRLPGISLTRMTGVSGPEPGASTRLDEKKGIEAIKVLSSRPEAVLNDPNLKEATNASSLAEGNPRDLVEQAPKQLAPTVSTPAEPAPDNPIAQYTTNAEPITAPKSLIVNPATRGRKAARKQDAAGQAPQAIVPFEAPQPVRPPRAKPADTRKNDGSLPGFTSANGGAWSKHAEDLLGMTRPTCRKG